MGGPGEDGQLRSKRTSALGPAPLAVVAMLVGASCGQSFTRAAAIESFANANPEATSEQAACVVDRLDDRYGMDQLESELAFEPLDPAFEEAQFRDMFRCGLAGDVQSQISQQLSDNGVSDADAPCVAENLVQTMTDDDIDVLLSGQITNEFATKFFQAMDDCGALNP